MKSRLFKTFPVTTVFIEAGPLIAPSPWAKMPRNDPSP